LTLARAKRYTVQLSKDVMAFFRECHKKVGAKNIGASVKDTILELRRQLEENVKSKNPSINPYTGKLLSKRDVAYIAHIQKAKGFETTKEAFAYFLGHIEKSKEIRLAQTFRQSLNEAPQPQETPMHPCPFYKYDNENDKVLCSRDLKKRGVIHRVPQEICRMCWNHQMERRQEQTCT
jgi:hypothetical protein